MLRVLCYLAGMVALIALNGCETIDLGKGDSGGAIRVSGGEVFRVVLNGDPSKGSWRVGELPDFVEMIGEPKYEGKGYGYGAFGEYRFKFRVTDEGRGPLRLVFRDPKDPEATPTDRFEVTIVAER